MTPDAPPPQPIVADHGAWASPLDAAAVAGERIAFDNLCAADGCLYWTESVPAEEGRVALFRWSAGAVERLSAPGSNVRTRVHEYGGAPFVVAGATIVRSEFSDQRLVAQPAATTPPDGAVPCTPPGYRYADGAPVPAGDGAVHALVFVREDHTPPDPDPAQVRNALVRLHLPAGGAGEVLYAASDFVAYPRPSPDGRRLAFIAWDHPRMPWDGTELKLAELTPAGLGAARTIAGGAAESVLEPQWDADGTLYFISDRSGYWNLYALRADGVQPVWPRAAEFARPLWTLGQANYALLGAGRAVARFFEGGRDRLALIDLARGTGRLLDLPYVEYAQLARVDAHRVALLAASATAPPAIVCLDVDTGALQVVRSAGRARLAPQAISVAVPLECPSEAGRTAHAYYYPPLNPAYAAAPGAAPPLLTLVHGGPTSQASPAYSAAVQFWTSRGVAVVDVDYAGSAGYGRAYRRRLEGQWGVADVADVIAVARHLAATGRADPARLAISGRSAGGYAVLVALSTSAVFSAGADYFGISDITVLARDTHKFESRYVDTLIGPLPEAQAVYDARSPLHHLDGFKAPLIVFQGADDRVVPPNQSALIVDALRARGAPVAYLLYPGEGHGFRKPENIVRSLQAELAFYGRVFGFTPADRLPELALAGAP